MLDLVRGDRLAQLLEASHHGGELLALRRRDPLELEPFRPHAGLLERVPQPLDAGDGLAVGVDVVAVGIVGPVLG